MVANIIWFVRAVSTDGMVDVTLASSSKDLLDVENPVADPMAELPV